ncbi:MAG: SDR family oxidoreductase [Alphaproteobacteria bacterium]|nr:SDR family oxidoreductase [Alphaproteobacteria bacterium]MCB9930121.1 SDR family oxidoreductase [Alphaproteobacteria bacterium]
MRLADKTILITGAGSGIGHALAERCLSEGAEVVAVDRDAGGMARLGTPLQLTGDVRDPDLAARAVALAEERTGKLDGLATVAGISRSGIAIDAISEEDWDAIFAINVKATWLWLKAAIPAFRRRGGGAVVTVASQLAFGGGAMNAAYIASKGAIVSLTKTAALELAPDHIRVNAIAPGATETPLFQAGMARNPNPAARENSRNRHAMKRFGQPHEIASGMLYLLSDEASWTTGHTLLVDGGWTAA